MLLASLRRKGFVRGFALVFVILLLISVGISGWASLTAYPHFLMRLSSPPLAGIHPAAMANIRGLVSISGIVKNTAGLALIWIVSIWLLWYAWMSFKRSKSTFTDATNQAFGNFVLAALLVSYHLSPTDLCIALLPIGLFSQYLAETHRNPAMGATQPSEQPVCSVPASLACDLASLARIRVPDHSDSDHVFAHIG